MKSSNALPTNLTRRNVGRSWVLSAFLASAATFCPAIFCSCESASSRSSTSRDSNPYAQNEPKNAEEEAYYRDVYSGDWRNQINPFGTGPSLCKKTGSTEAPPHWSTVPAGSKSMDEIRFETAQRKAAEARRFASAPYAQAPTQSAYGTQAQLPAPQYPLQPTPPQTPTIEYPQAQTTLPAQNVQYVSQVPEATPQYPQPISAPVNQPQPQPQPATAPTQNVYPQPIYQGAALRYNFLNDRFSETPIIRGQTPENEDDPFADEATDEPQLDVETKTKNEDESQVELKAENVKEMKAAPNASVSQPAVSQDVKNDANVPATSGEGPSNRIGGRVLPLQIDPSIAAPFANVRRPLPNPAQPANPEAKRASQDEYVVTGGDSKDAMFSREDWTVENLDAEDSAAHFDAVDGRILSEPSNKLFLYSPRFGAVRQIVGPLEGEQRLVLESANATTQVAQGDASQSVDVREQETKLLGATNALAVGSAESSASAAIVDAGQGLIEATSLIRLGAMLTSDSIDELESKDAALLLQGAVAAQGWSGEQKVAVALETVNAFSNAYVAGAETIFSVKDDTKTSKLRLIKIANKDAARPGELVEFTLRFENIGDEPIGNVTILDNLSARLAYVAGSAKSSVQAEFLADLNEQGSLILRWEITEPLEPKEFGVVRFICKVR